MKLKLDHVFVLVEPQAKVANLLIDKGFQEGKSNDHPGQGTTNRRFYFANGMLEFLWVRDAQEANKGPAQDLRFPDRVQTPTASPFGAILLRQDNTSLQMPFPGWTYQPDYFAPPRNFHVGENSTTLAEPLCFYVPFIAPEMAIPKPEGNPQAISQVIIQTPSPDTHGILTTVSKKTDRLFISQGSEHLMEITLNEHEAGVTHDFRPHIPLIIHL